MERRGKSFLSSVLAHLGEDLGEEERNVSRYSLALASGKSLNWREGGCSLLHK